MEITLEFNTKKEYARFLKQLGAGKGFVVKAHHIKAGGSIGSFFRSVGNTLKKTVNDIKNDQTVKNIYNTAKPIVKPIAQKVLPEMANILASSKGGPIAGIVAQQATQNAVDGMGLFDNFGRKAKNTVRKIKNTINNKDIQRALNSTAGKQLKDIGKRAIHQAIAEHHMSLAENTNNPFAQEALGVLANTAHDNVDGLGLKRRGGSRFEKGSAEAKEHMARLRSLKLGHRGRSIMPLG